MSGHSGKIATAAGSGGGRGNRRRHAAEEQDQGGRRSRTGRRKAAPAADSARPHLSARLAKAGLLGVVMALGATVAAVAAPTGNNNQAAQAAAAPTCALEVPDQPFSATGLATPYRLVGVGGTKCAEGDAGTAAFVQGLVLDPATGKLAVYDPLVIDAGTSPAVAPVVPALPANAVVALWFGFNGSVLTLQGNGAASCVNGLPGSPFGQFSYCGAPAFFSAAQTAIAAGKLVVPPLGTAADHNPCPTTRDFGLVDQDQSDNVTTTYLVLADGRTAQDTHAASAKLAKKSPQVLANGSDNLLLDHFVDPALNCLPFTAPNLADNGTAATALGLNELQAAASQKAPVALVPLSDPMVLDDTGATSDNKTDLYRAGVDQPPLAQVPGSPTEYCRQLRIVGVTRTEQDRALTATEVSPDPGAATDLFAFLAMRLQMSYTNLACQQYLHMRNPVHLKMNGAGLVTGATFDLVAGPSPSPSASPGGSAGSSASASPSPSQSPSRASTTPAPPTTPTTTTAPPQSSTSAAAPPPPPPPPHTTTAPPPPASSPATVTSPAANAGTKAPPGGNVAAPSVSVSAGVSVSAAGGPNDSSAATGAAAGGPAGSANPAKSPNTGTAAAGAGQPGTDVAASPTGTTVRIAGFEHTPAAVAAANPRSALSGPDPMANSGFSLTSSRMLWGAGGALAALCLSLLLRRRPRRR